MIEWDASLAVGVAENDEQHQAIIRLINDLASRQGQAEEADAAKALAFLLETELMLDLGYPELDAHRQQHEQFANHVIFFEIEKEFGVVSEQMLADILVFLQEWFISHITKEDKALGEFVRTQAMSG